MKSLRQRAIVKGGGDEDAGGTDGRESLDIGPRANATAGIDASIVAKKESEIVPPIERHASTNANEQRIFVG